MKITIITSCYNHEATIRECIESVHAQDYPDIEYIVIDGASTDGSLAVIRSEERKMKSEEFISLHPRFSFRYISEPDHGMYEAINKGLRMMATGDYIGLVHSDDFLYSPHTVSHTVQRLEQTKADFLYGDGLFVSNGNTGKVMRNWLGGEFCLWKVRHGWLPLHPTCYISREVM